MLWVQPTTAPAALDSPPAIVALAEPGNDSPGAPPEAAAEGDPAVRLSFSAPREKKFCATCAAEKKLCRDKFRCGAQNESLPAEVAKPRRPRRSLARDTLCPEEGDGTAEGKTPKARTRPGPDGKRWLSHSSLVVMGRTPDRTFAFPV